MHIIFFGYSLQQNKQKKPSNALQRHLWYAAFFHFKSLEQIFSLLLQCKVVFH